MKKILLISACAFGCILLTTIILTSCQNNSKADQMPLPTPEYRMQLIERHHDGNDDSWNAIYKDSKTGIEIAVFYREGGYDGSSPSLTSVVLNSNH